MMPFNTSMRELARKYIPTLTDEIIDQFEALSAYRVSINQRILMNPDFLYSDLTSELNKIQKEMNRLLDNTLLINTASISKSSRKRLSKMFRIRRTVFGLIDLPPIDDLRLRCLLIKALDMIHELWIARRQLAAAQGYFFQIPHTLTRIRNYYKAARHLIKTSFRVLPRLWRYKITIKSEEIRRDINFCRY
ncbi:MAG: hypothetical protein V2J62_02110 [candidate division KSB1 bacterium]|jgi:hypothetical protein|nr:hypothetical protein [candidate division KSB1 bacterium]